MLLFLLDKHLGVERLHHIVGVCLNNLHSTFFIEKNKVKKNTSEKSEVIYIKWLNVFWYIHLIEEDF